MHPGTARYRCPFDYAPGRSERRGVGASLSSIGNPRLCRADSQSLTVPDYAVRRFVQDRAGYDLSVPFLPGGDQAPLRASRRKPPPLVVVMTPDGQWRPVRNLASQLPFCLQFRLFCPPASSFVHPVPLVAASGPSCDLRRSALRSVFRLAPPRADGMQPGWVRWTW